MSLKNKIISQAALAACLLAGASSAFAQARIVPTDPVQFERVSLRQTVDDCVFDAERVRVSHKNGTIVVEQPQNYCLVPGKLEVVDILLGAFPAGDYQVEIRNGYDVPASERVSFRVNGVVKPAVVPTPASPLANFGGLWWSSTESGWGLSIEQGNLYTMFGALYVFGADRQPEWYTLGSGQWVSPTVWEGEIFKTQGPSWSAPVFDPTVVQNIVSGTATLDFTQVPGHVDQAELRYTIDGVTVTKEISRARF